ncbi:MAG: hypothetical protein E7435_06740 [Ruminococcaceae bacterium]|nr:hypothetical protein [Oscillospiraceae bacterium]
MKVPVRINSATTDICAESWGSVIALDRTVAAVLKFMEENPDTLLVITSDHETGGVQLPVTGEEKLNDLLTVTDHTATPVRVLALARVRNILAARPLIIRILQIS